jgi:hypothetical protein
MKHVKMEVTALGGKLKLNTDKNPSSTPKSPLRSIDSPTSKPSSKGTNFMAQRNKG